MRRRLSRWLWLTGITLLIMHAVILLAAAYGNRDSPRQFATSWDQPLINIAMWIFEGRPEYLLFHAIINGLMLALCIFTLRRKTRLICMTALIVVRVVCAAACIASLWHLAAVSPVVVRTSPLTTTIYNFGGGMFRERLAVEGFILFPVIVFAALAFAALRRDKFAVENQQLCRNCGYDLHGNMSNRCPECGCLS